MPIERRFAFTETLKTGRQRLVQAELDAAKPFKPRTAHIVAELAQVPGELPSDSSVPQTYVWIRPSPSNAFIAVFAAEIGLDFVDYNVGVYDQMTGAAMHLNEHSFSGTSRANCVSPLFEAFLASEAANGVPPADLANYGYSVEVEGTGIGEPEIAWTPEETVLVRYGFDVLLTFPGSGGSGVNLGRDQFEFELATSGPGPTILSRNAGRPHAPLTRSLLHLVPGPHGTQLIAFGRGTTPLPFGSGWRRYLPWLGWLGIPGLLRYQKADHVGGHPK